MGSGAFLVQAARVLGRALARIRAVRAGARVTPDLVRRAERDVVRECVYGVDLNPLAVVLAKVSLWLETLEPGRPLSFLDAHLRCGDSLVGVNFALNGGTLTAAELATWPPLAHKGLERYLKAEAGERGEPVLARLRTRKAPRQPKQATLPESMPPRSMQQSGFGGDPAVARTADPLEHEAEVAAGEVMRKPRSGSVEAKLQRKPSGLKSVGVTLPGSVQEALRSPGQPLDSAAPQAKYNKAPGEYTRRFPGGGAAANAQSATKHGTTARIRIDVMGR